MADAGAFHQNRIGAAVGRAISNMKKNRDGGNLPARWSRSNCSDGSTSCSRPTASRRRHRRPPARGGDPARSARWFSRFRWCGLVADVDVGIDQRHHGLPVRSSERRRPAHRPHPLIAAITIPDQKAPSSITPSPTINWRLIKHHGGGRAAANGPPANRRIKERTTHQHAHPARGFSVRHIVYQARSGDNLA